MSKKVERSNNLYRPPYQEKRSCKKQQKCDCRYEHLDSNPETGYGPLTKAVAVLGAAALAYVAYQNRDSISNAGTDTWNQFRSRWATYPG